MDKLWRLHDCTEERKVKLAASEFEGYRSEERRVGKEC